MADEEKNNRPATPEDIGSAFVNGAFQNHYKAGFSVVFKRAKDIQKFNELWELRLKAKQDYIDLLRDMTEELDAALDVPRDVLDMVESGDLDPERVIDTYAVRDNETIASLRRRINALKNHIEKLDKIILGHNEEMKKNVTTFTATSKVAELSVTRDNEQLAQCSVGFHDRYFKFFSSIEQGDYVDVQLGWEDGVSDRYVIQPVFSGIVTNKLCKGGGGSPSTCEIVCHDERILLGDQTYSNSFAEFNSDFDFAKYVLTFAGPTYIPNYTGVSRDRIILYNQSPYHDVRERLKSQNYKIITIPSEDGTVYAAVPAETKDQTFTFALKYSPSNSMLNVIDWEARVDWIKPKDRAEGTTPDTTTAELVNDQNDNIEDSDPKEDLKESNGLLPETPVDTTNVSDHGPDTTPQSSNYSAVKAENDARNSLMSRQLMTASLTVRGEPKITENSAVLITGTTSYLDGLWEVDSVEQNLSSGGGYTTKMELAYLGTPILEDLQDAIDSSDIPPRPSAISSSIRSSDEYKKTYA